MSSKRAVAHVFDMYVGQSSSGMTSSKFLKVMKDANLLDSSLKQSDLDLIFTKVKSPGLRNIDCDGFRRALSMVASRKNVSYEDLVDYIQMATADGPSFAGTTIAQQTRFYDDRETYTGVHRAGGPTVVDKDKQTLDRLLDRSPADVRGLKPVMKEAHGRQVKTSPQKPQQHAGEPGLPRPAPAAQPSRAAPPAPPTPRGGMTESDASAMLQNLESRIRRTSLSGGDPFTASGGKASRSPQQSTGQGSLSTPTTRPSRPAPQHNSPAPQWTTPDPEQALYELYKTFCSNQETLEMDSFRFVKFCRDSQLLGGPGLLTTTDADLIFQKSKKSGNYGKRISYEDFRMVAIPEVAKKLRRTVEDVIFVALQSEGPTLNNPTLPSEVRFHDDVSTYTGVHHNGQTPSFSPSRTTVELENLLDRSPADARGVKLASPVNDKVNKSRPSVTIAGEANKPGGIFDRLSSEKSFTGVYAERFKSPHANKAQQFRGHTNTGTDEPVYDISQVVQRR